MADAIEIVVSTDTPKIVVVDDVIKQTVREEVLEIVLAGEVLEKWILVHGHWTDEFYWLDTSTWND